MRVALADDSGIMRSGLTRLLETAGVEVCYAAPDADSLLAYLEVDRPDAVILDVRMPPTFTEEGLRAAERIKADHPRIGVLVLSTYGVTAYALQLMNIPEPGIGYLLKDRVDDVHVVISALERVAAGRYAIDPEIVGEMLHRRASASTDVLAEREREVLQLMAEGMSNAGIAEALCISPRTVDGHAARVFAKLGLTDDANGNRRVLAVLAWLRDSGSIPPGQQ